MLTDFQLNALIDYNGKAMLFTKSYTPKRRLKLLRETLELNGSEFARSVGYSKSSYSLFESGKSEMSPKFLRLVKEKYGISPDWLLTGGENILADPAEMESKNEKAKRMRAAIQDMIEVAYLEDLEIIYNTCKRLQLYADALSRKKR